MLFVYVYLPCVFPRYICLYPRLEDLSTLMYLGERCVSIMFQVMLGRDTKFRVL